MPYFREIYLPGDPKCRKAVFQTLKELRTKDGVGIENLPLKLLDYFEGLTIEESQSLVLQWLEWQKRIQRVLESFGIW